MHINTDGYICLQNVSILLQLQNYVIFIVFHIQPKNYAHNYFQDLEMSTILVQIN
jgi:hypothetical protein